MKQELEQILYTRYPHLFAEKDLPMNQTCMCWGIECGDGWFDLIDRTCKRIMEIDIGHHVVFTQVKEKYASLRIYFTVRDIDCMNDDLWVKVENITSEADDESKTICERCGNPGKVVGGGWLYTLCEKCQLNKGV
jgi:hypothetical protein